MENPVRIEGNQVEQISSEISKGRVLTIQIPRDQIKDYVLAGSKTDFRIREIAGEGEEFPYWDIDPNILPEPEDSGKDTNKSFYSGLSESPIRVRAIRVLRDHIAIAVIRPEKVESFKPFWAEVRERKA